MRLNNHEPIPAGVHLTDDELWTIVALIGDWGWDYGLRADRSKVAALAKRLGQIKLASEVLL